MTDNIADFPKAASEGWHFPYHEADRVIIEGREIPRLRAINDGDEVSLILDGRFSINVPQAYGSRVAWLVANALAIGAGYPFLGATSKEQPFAPVCTGLSEIPI